MAAFRTGHVNNVTSCWQTRRAGQMPFCCLHITPVIRQKLFSCAWQGVGALWACWHDAGALASRHSHFASAFDWSAGELVGICREMGCDFETDPSNKDHRFERVRTRHQLALMRTTGIRWTQRSIIWQVWRTDFANVLIARFAVILICHHRIHMDICHLIWLI